MPTAGNTSKQKQLFTILKHVSVWLVVFLLPYVMRYNNDNRFFNEWRNSGFFWIDSLSKVLWIIVFYFNAYFLTERFVYRRRYLTYTIILLAIFGAAISYHELLNSFFHADRFIHIRSDMAAGKKIILRDADSVGHMIIRNKDAPDFPRKIKFDLRIALIFNLPAFLLTIATSIAYRMIIDKTKSDALAQQQQEETLKTELSFLRSQISPHFVFNVLNNIAALARLKSDQLEPTIIKMSSLMRYMLYEANEQKVSVRTEVDYLRSYIDLQSQRFGNRVDTDIHLEETEDSFREIEPMLLIPFVENAFKHGIGLVLHPYIKVRLFIKEDTLHFEVRNKFVKNSTDIKDKASGIGLVNVQRRLNLLYDKTHNLDIQETKDEQGQDWFDISLKIKLHQ